MGLKSITPSLTNQRGRPFAADRLKLSFLVNFYVTIIYTITECLYLHGYRDHQSSGTSCQIL